MKNVLLLLGRGIEGTGNTRITIELEEYLKSQGIDALTVASSDKAWGRDKSQENDIELYKFSQGAYVPKVIPDICVIMSVPAKRKTPASVKANPDLLKTFMEEQTSIYEGFTKTLESLKLNGTKIVYLQVDHKIHSINRNYYAVEDYTRRFFPLIDRMITPKLDNDFIKKFVVKKVAPLNIDGIHYDMKEQLLISCNFDEEASIVGKSDKINGLCYFIGRSARWKGWTEFRDFHYNYLRKDNFIAMIEGIELSINGKEDLYHKEGKKFTTVRDENIVYISDKENTPEVILSKIETNPSEFYHIPAMVFGPYNRREAMKRVSRAKFGMFFTYLGEEFSGPIEITFLEIVASGTLPVIKKELWETAQFNGDRLSNYKPEDIGLVLYDSEHPEWCADTLKTLDYSEDLYNQYLSKITDFCKHNFDRSVILKRVKDLIDIA